MSPQAVSIFSAAIVNVIVSVTKQALLLHEVNFKRTNLKEQKPRNKQNKTKNENNVSLIVSSIRGRCNNYGLKP